MYELKISFEFAKEQRSNQDLISKTKLLDFLHQLGRSHFVEGIIDGVNDLVSENEQKDAVCTWDRIDAAPISLYDADRTCLEDIIRSIEKEFRINSSESSLKAIFEISELVDTSWQSAWMKDGFSPWSTKRFSIMESPVSLSKLNEQERFTILVELDHKFFGTGEHATTRCLLRLMESKWESWGVQSFLDVGCGIGILAIAAAKLGARRVVATEISDDIVASAKHHAALNCVEVDVRRSENLPTEVKFDVIVANILVPVLHNLMNEFYSQLKQGGTLVLSGFVQKESEPLLKKAEMFGFELISTEDENGWLALELKKQLKKC